MMDYSEYLEALTASKAAMQTHQDKEDDFYASGYVADKTGGDPVETYRRALSHRAQGVSGVLTEAETLARQEEDEDKQDLLFDIMAAPDLSDDEKSQIFHEYSEKKRSIKDAFIDTQAAAYSPDDEERFLINKDRLYEKLETSANIQRVYNQFHAETEVGFGEDIPGTIGGLALYAAPGVDQVFTNALAYNLDNSKYWADFPWDAKYLAETGTAREDLQKYLLALPEAEQDDALEEFINILKEVPGSDLQKVTAVDALTGREAGWERKFDNVIGYLEAAFGIGAVVKWTKIGPAALRLRYMGNTPEPAAPFSVLKDANPDNASQLAASIILENGQEIANASGVTKLEVATDVAYPRIDPRIVSNAPADVVSHLEDIKNLEAQLVKDSNLIDMVIETGERAAQRKDWAERTEKTTGLKTAVGESHIIDHGNSYDVTARLYDGDAKPFKTHEEALLKAQDNFKDGTYEIVQKDGEVWSAGKAGKGEYAIQLKYNQAYDPELVDIFGAPALKGTEFGEPVVRGTWMGAARKYVLDPASSFAPWITKAFERSADMAVRMETQLVDELQKSFKGIKGEGLRRVNQVIVNGNDTLRQMGKDNFSYEDLISPAIGLNKAEAKAVLGFQEVNRIVYNADNKLYTKGLRERGAKWLVDSASNGVDRIYGFPASLESLSAGQYITDTASHAAEAFTKSELAALYAKGGEVIRLERSIHNGTSKFEYAIVDPTKARLQDVPDNALPYRPMHYTRFYEEYYKVEASAKKGLVNGQPGVVSKTVAMFGTKKEADEWVRANTSSLEEWNLVPSRVAELSTEERMMADALQRGDGSYIRSSRKRGEHIAGAEPGGLARAADPLQAIFRSIQGVSHRVTREDVVKGIQTRLLKTLAAHDPNIYNKIKDSGFPTSKEDILKLGLREEDVPMVQAIVDYTNTVQGMPTAYKREWTNAVMHLAEMLDKGGLPPKYSRRVKDIGIKYDPTNMFKAIGFRRYIQGRPLRQALLQSSQLLQYTALSPKLNIPGKMMGMLSAMTTKDLKVAGKMAGYSAEEMGTLVDFWKRSGLKESVLSHPHYARGIDNIENQPITSGGTVMQRTDMAITNTLGQGFIRGEQLNLLGAFVTAYERFKSTNKGKVPGKGDVASLNQIAADARALSYSMNKGGRMAYQDGWASAATQFMSVPHKALLMTTFNRRFTTAEKARLAAWNFALFGEFAFSMTRGLELVRQQTGFDPAPENKELWDKIHGGLVQWGLNAALVGEGDVAFSKAFSVTEGSDFMLHFLSTLSEKPVQEWVFGAGLHAATDYWKNSLGRIPLVFGSEKLDTVDKIKESLLHVSEFAAGMSDFQKARWARHSAIFYNRSGRADVAASLAEANAAIFGIGSEGLRKMQEVSSRQYDRQKEIKEEAKAFVEKVNYLSRLEDDDAFDRQIRVQRMLMAWYPEEDRQDIMSAASGMLYFGAKAGEDNLYSNIIKRMWSGGNPDDIQMDINSYPNPKGRKQLQEMFDVFKGEDE